MKQEIALYIQFFSVSAGVARFAEFGSEDEDERIVPEARSLLREEDVLENEFMLRGEDAL